MENMGESKTITQGTKWGKQNHCIGTLMNMANSVLKAIHTMCSYLSYLFQCIIFTLFTYNKMKERCACVCAMCEFIYHC